MFDYDTFRVNLILSRKRLKVTQESLAEEAEISEKNLSKIEKAKQEPNLPTIISILNYFNTSVEMFMDSDFEDNQNKTVILNKIRGYVSDLSEQETQFFTEVVQLMKGEQHEN